MCTLDCARNGCTNTFRSPPAIGDLEYRITLPSGEVLKFCSLACKEAHLEFLEVPRIDDGYHFPLGTPDALY